MFASRPLYGIFFVSRTDNYKTEEMASIWPSGCWNSECFGFLTVFMRLGQKRFRYENLLYPLTLPRVSPIFISCSSLLWCASNAVHPVCEERQRWVELSEAAAAKGNSSFFHVYPLKKAPFFS